MPRDTELSDPSLASRPAVRIRPARREDAGAVVRMLLRLAAQGGEAEWDVLGDEAWATALVAEAGPALVGCAVYGRHHRTPFAERCLDLASLYVAPAWRGRGVGRALVEAVLHHARDVDCSRVTVATAAQNARSRAFYERLGFERAPLPGPRVRTLVSPALPPT